MTRDELAALHAALGTVLTWPPAVLAEVARWLTPAAPQPGNGLDPHPPSITPRSGESTATPSVAVLSEAPGQRAPHQGDPGASGRAAASDGDGEHPA